MAELEKQEPKKDEKGQVAEHDPTKVGKRITRLMETTTHQGEEVEKEAEPPTHFKVVSQWTTKIGEGPQYKRGEVVEAGKIGEPLRKELLAVGLIEPHKPEARRQEPAQPATTPSPAPTPGTTPATPT